MRGVDWRHIDTEAEEVFMLKNFSKAEEKGDGEEEVKHVDPIQWYGLLPAQTLKDAQERFVKGNAPQRKSSDVIVLEEGVEVANFMVKLKSSEEHIEQIRRKRGIKS
jgi:hypothetical protein